MNNDSIVIVGGMGPQASLELHKRILLKSRAHHGGAPEEYPQINHLSLSIKDFISNKKQENAAIKSINKALGMVVIDSRTQLCIPCNTAHGLIDRINVPAEQFVSIIDATISEVSKSGKKSIGLLASPNTLESGLYSKPLKKLGFRVIEPSLEDKDLLQRLIRAVISGESVDVLRSELETVAQNMIAQGADLILLGCTELPIIGLPNTIPVVDSLDSLTNELIRRKYLL